MQSARKVRQCLFYQCFVSVFVFVFATQKITKQDTRKLQGKNKLERSCVSLQCRRIFGKRTLSTEVSSRIVWGVILDSQSRGMLGRVRNFSPLQGGGQ